MAECKDCFHYNACATMYEAAIGSKPKFITHNADRCNDFIHAADVVPKSEVAKEFTCFVGDPHKVERCPYLDEIEKAKSEVERLQTEIETLKDTNEHLAVMLEEARQEVAREIFEEIEREINDALQSNYKVLPIIEESEALWNRVSGKIDALRGIGGFIDELKDKYTEGET